MLRSIFRFRTVLCLYYAIFISKFFKKTITGDCEMLSRHYGMGSEYVRNTHSINEILWFMAVKFTNHCHTPSRGIVVM